MTKYVVRDVDYTGCNPVIAAVLQSGKEIKCNCYDSTGAGHNKRWVARYIANNKYCYVTDCGEFKYATPIEGKRIAMSFPEIAKWLDDHNYVCNGKGEWEWISNGACKMPVYPSYLFCYCGREIPDGVFFPEEWLVKNNS